MLEERSPEENILQEAQIALQKGEKGRARDLLTRLIKSNKASAQLWLLMSAAVESNKERIFCLGEALRYDPQNQHARRGLIALGARPPEEGLGIPLAVQKRNWEAAFFGRVSPESEAANRAFRQLAVVAGLVIVFIAAIVIAILAGGSRANNPVPLAPINTRGPTVTYVATASPVVRSPTATFTGPTPLAMILNLDYTPTPVYVTTPHNLEDYNRGLRMMKDGNWTQAVISFQNAIQAAPDAADIYYLLGEVYRLQKKYTEASQNYDKALKINPNFAVAFYNRDPSGCTEERCRPWYKTSLRLMRDTLQVGWEFFPDLKADVVTWYWTPEEEREAFKREYIAFTDGLVSHYWLDDGKLVVAHADGLPVNWQTLVMVVMFCM